MSEPVIFILTVVIVIVLFCVTAIASALNQGKHDARRAQDLTRKIEKIEKEVEEAKRDQILVATRSRVANDQLRIDCESAKRKLKQELELASVEKDILIANANSEMERLRKECQEELADKKAELKRLEEHLIDVVQKSEAAMRQNKEESQQILHEASVGFPWLARALANYELLNTYRDADHLEVKVRPARKAAAILRESAEQGKQIRAEYYVARSRIDYYESLFPWLEDYVGIDVDTLIECVVTSPSEAPNAEDPVRRYLATGEYDQLPSVQRNQLALDRYMASRKSPWEIGRAYERYMGYCYEKEGYDVEYHGIMEGFCDAGRDLIATRGRTTKIIQCKCWALHKEIHEKHIAQLFGTTVKYHIERRSDVGIIVGGVFVTSTRLSSMAMSFAKELNIEVRQNTPLEEYPIVKCNVGRDEFGAESLIYHLPMDQQYDRTKVCNPGECYVGTVAEAEALGFRRAWRYRG